MSLTIINEKLKKIKIIEKNINYKYNPSYSNDRKKINWKRHIYFHDLKTDFFDEISSLGFSYYNIIPSKQQKENFKKFKIKDKYNINYLKFIKKNPKLFFSNSNLLANKKNLIINNTNNNNNNEINNNHNKNNINIKQINKHFFTKSSLNIFSRPNLINNNNNLNKNLKKIKNNLIF